MFAWAEVLGAAWPLIRCELGLHKWKLVVRHFPYVTAMPLYGFYVPDRWREVAKVCRCCGKRVDF
jgi:hypothetical protein